MINIDNYIECFLKVAKDVYGERLVYVGLQGSYLRGEAHENSDIDIMVLIDGFSVSDMDQYREILNRIGHVEKSCGFICGKDDMMNWNPLESIQLQYTTKDLYGILTDFLPAATREDEINYVKLSIGNLFHEICHRYIHGGREKSALKLRGTCKGLFFIIQNLYYLESGDFVGSRSASLMKIVRCLNSPSFQMTMILMLRMTRCLSGVRRRLCDLRISDQRPVYRNASSSISFHLTR